MAGILVRGGQIVSDGRCFRGDVLLAGATIAAVGANLAAEAGGATIVDASGCQVFPGGVDPHVHMALETPAGVSADDFASGSRAALAGGTTTIIDFVTPRRHESLTAALAVRREAALAAVCDYGLHMSVTAWSDRTLSELEECCRSGGIGSVKAYLAYKETIGLDDGEFLALLDAARQLNFLTLVHAESGDMISYLQRRLLESGKTSAAGHPLSRPPDVEGDAVSRALLMARLAGVPLYVVHVSTRQGIDAVAAARRLGQGAIAETCPQYLLLDEDRYQGDVAAAALHVMSPPLRQREHQAALWEALAAGVAQAIGSDHCPFSLDDKQRHAADDFTRVPGGTGGVEYRLPLLFTFGVKAGRISLPRFVDLVSSRPAKLFGLFPRKGTLRPGSDADLVVWDPEKEWTVSASDQWQRGAPTVYAGLELRGAPRLVFSRGEAVCAEGRVEAREGRGAFLDRGPGRGSDGRAG
ncbi:MAG: dihydropyrimidinase [Acidobacteria bacterium]|jgi:dihydropyrimidinase|nr:dihydropyrimidinase [Acidobacteriota bacterium]